MAHPYSYMAAAAILAALLGYLLWTAPPTPTRTTAAVLATDLLAWLVGEILVAASPSASTASLAIRFTYAAIGLIPISVARFVSTLDELADPLSRLAVTLSAILGVSTLVLLPSDLLIAGAVWDSGGFRRIPGPLFLDFAILLFVGLVLDCALIVRASRRASEPIQRLRCQYIVFGVATSASLGLVDLVILQPLGIRAHRMFMAPLGVTLSSTSIILAIARTRLVDLPTAVRRTAVYIGLLATLLVPCLGISLLAEQLMTGDIAVGPSIVTAFLFCLAGFGFPQLRVAAEQTFEQALFGARADERRLLRAASREVTSVLSLSKLAEVTRTTVAQAFGDVDAHLWLRRNDHFLALDHGQPDIPPSATQVLIRWAEKANEAIVRSELIARRTQGDLADVLAGSGIELAVPLRMKEKTVGLLTLGPRGDDRVYTDDDIALVVTLANQVAIALENARLYEEVRSSRAQVHRASRLSAIGTLAAGVAHEIRNPLVAVRTFLQLVPERMNDPEFMTKFRALSLSEIDRITKLITQLLSFSRSHDRPMASVNVKGVVEKIVDLLRLEAGKRSVQVELLDDEPVPLVHGDAEQIEQVVLNVVLNAIQATPMESKVVVHIQTARTLTGEAQVRVEVTDQGPGIPPENLDALFTPFFTTKEQGTGLGLAVAQQIMTEHGGSLEVVSPPGEGATFSITLPALADEDGKRMAGDEAAPPVAAASNQRRVA